MTTPNDLYRGPVKRSIQIAGHLTSISLEPLFWDMLRAAAETRALPLNALVARIDVERIEADDPPNLASAIRLWLMRDLVEHCPRAPETTEQTSVAS